MSKNAFMEENFFILYFATMVLMGCFAISIYSIGSKLSKIIKERYPELSQTYNANIFTFSIPYICYNDARIEKLNDPDINKTLRFLKIAIISWLTICFGIFFLIGHFGVGYTMVIGGVFVCGSMYLLIRKNKELLEYVFNQYPDLYENTLKSVTSTRNNRIPLPDELKEMRDPKLDDLMRSIKIFTYLPFALIPLVFIANVFFLS